MDKFSGDWSPSRIRDLIVSHKNRSHSETAIHLSKMWGVLVSRDSVKNKFISETRNGATEVEPKNNREIFDIKVNDEGKKGKRVYFVTSAIAGCSLNSAFCRAVKVFCKVRDAKLVVLPMRGIASKDEEYSQEVMAELAEHFVTEYTFNSNLEAFDIGLTPTQVNPLTGLNRLAQKKSSLLVASPKQQMETIPVSNVGIPHIIHSTGSITNPSYHPNRVGMLATEDHVVGGLVVEVENDQIFHLRQVQASRDGSFYDLDKQYLTNGVKSAEIEAFVMGDYHCGNEDPTAVKAWQEAVTFLKPKNIFFHDTFDSRSVSHHEEHNLNAKITRAPVFAFLKNELDNMVNTLYAWHKKYPKSELDIVRSNHDAHLDRYLDEGRFVKDHHNCEVAIELFAYRLKGKNILKEYMDKRVGEIPQIKWLERDEDFKVAGIQLAAHGDIGPNGAKGSLGGAEKSYYKAVIGHYHSPRILRGVYQVGTSTKFKLSYNTGPSNWLHCSCLVYKNGARSLIISIDGKWKN